MPILAKIALFLRQSVVQLSLISLSSCTLFPEPDSAPKLIQLTAPSSVTLKESFFCSAQLIINRPSAESLWNTHRLSLLKSPHFIDYYAGLSWTDKLPIVLQTLLVETFEKTKTFESVERTPLGSGPKYVLMTEIRSFSANYRQGIPPVIEIALKVDLFDPKIRRILKSGFLTAKTKATADTVDGIVAAFTQATHEILQKFVMWTVEKKPEEALECSVGRLPENFY